jgi:hypothetical protein
MVARNNTPQEYDRTVVDDGEEKSRVKVSVKRIRRFLLKVPTVQNAFSCSLSEAIHYRTLAYQEYKALRKKEALPMREKFQGTLTEAIALKKGTDVETEAKRLRTTERQRRQGRNIKRMRGTYGNSRVTKLWFTEPDGTRILCDTQLSMERACFEENETRFSQSEQTPPMQSPTLKELGLLGDTEQINAILTGNYISPARTDRYTKELLKEMRMPATISRLSRRTVSSAQN